MSKQQPIKTGSRNLHWQTRTNSGIGRCVDVYTSRTGTMYVIMDDKTGRVLRLRQSQVARL
jgi:glucose/arabinose dehydrogenase